LAGNRHSGTDAVIENSATLRADDQARPRTVSDAVPRQFLAGDAMRGIGALCVVLFHAAQLSLYWKHSPGYEVTNESAHVLRPVAGVFAPPLSVLRGAIYIFFALSGYLLTRAFLASYTTGCCGSCPPSG
jgi:peptidoglycan/LPS O-acetylase OafA/YrhL